MAQKRVSSSKGSKTVMSQNENNGSGRPGTAQHIKNQKKSTAIAINEPRNSGAKMPKGSPKT